MGQDTPTSLLGSPNAIPGDVDSLRDYMRLRKVPPIDAIAGRENWDFSALMMGAGDARHLYASLLDIENATFNYRSQVPERPAQGPRIHFTLVSLESLGLSQC